MQKAGLDDQSKAPSWFSNWSWFKKAVPTTATSDPGSPPRPNDIDAYLKYPPYGLTSAPLGSVNAGTCADDAGPAGADAIMFVIKDRLDEDGFKLLKGCTDAGKV